MDCYWGIRGVFDHGSLSIHGLTPLQWYLMGPTEDDGLNLLVRAACRRNSDDVDDALWEEARKYSKSDPFAKLPVELLHGIPPVLQAFLSAQS
jgi:hypothetical protein